MRVVFCFGNFTRNEHPKPDVIMNQQRLGSHAACFRCPKHTRARDSVCLYTTVIRIDCVYSTTYGSLSLNDLLSSVNKPRTVSLKYWLRPHAQFHTRAETHQFCKCVYINIIRALSVWGTLKQIALWEPSVIAYLVYEFEVSENKFKRNTHRLRVSRKVLGSAYIIFT